MTNQTGQIVLADLYDYPSFPFVQTHPDRLATLALLAGLNPAPVDKCRFLEVACGEGANILSMAYTLPNSTFLGLDLGKTPIEKANAAIAALGLKNVRCLCQNLLDFDAGGQKFDYVVAHGFYSWVPQIVRDKLMALISEVLAPHGVAYISYNVYPGCYSEHCNTGDQSKNRPVITRPLLADTSGTLRAPENSKGGEQDSYTKFHRIFRDFGERRT